MSCTYRPEDIEVITTVRFATPDGEIHNTLAEALAHTPPRPVTYKMWKSDKNDGIVPADIDSCAFLFLPDMDSVRDFEKDSRECGCCVDGIEEPGWYTWNSNLFEWESMIEDVRIILEYLNPEE